MAVKLEDKENVTTPTGTYPYGRIKDDTGVNDGTPVNRAVYGDFHQFFARMLAISGLTPNGLPENSVNGFQYFEALQEIIKVFTGGTIDIVIPIGVWNMDSDATINVAHGIASFDAAKVKGVYVGILTDSADAHYPLGVIDPTDAWSPQGGVAEINATNVTLTRKTSGVFDAAVFDDAVMNRGYITIKYTV